MKYITKFMLCSILSVLPILAIPYVLKDNLSNLLYSNSVFSVVLYICFFLLLKYTFSLLEKRLTIISVIVGFLFSACMVFGASLIKTGTTAIGSPLNWVKVVFLSPIFFALTAIILNKLSQLAAAESDNPSCKIKLNNKKIFFVLWALIFISWIPFFLASYPGMFGYDSIHQANYYKNGIINLGHPIMHTYFLGFCVVTIGKILGSNEAGMAVYSIIQMLCLSAAFSSMYAFFIRKRLNKFLKTLIILWYMFFPVNAIMGFSSTKDVLFTAFFTLTMMMLLVIAETPNILKSKKFCILFGLITFLMLIFRSQGIYLFVLSMFVAFIILKNYRKQIFAIFLSCVIVFAVYSGPFSTMLGGIKGNSLREMMSVPCVQLSRAMVENNEELTEEQKQLIKEYVSGYHIYPVNSGISDYMKGSLNTDRIKTNPLEFAKLWLGVGLKCPGTYIDAFCRLTIGLWYPDMNYRDPLAYHPYWEYWSTGEWNGYGSTEFIQMKQAPVKGFEWLYNILSDLSYKNTYQEVPIISMLFSSGLMIWLFVIYVAFCIYKKLYRNFIPITFLLGLVLTLLLGPVVLFRYVYPVFTSIPLLLASVGGSSAVSMQKLGE